MKGETEIHIKSLSDIELLEYTKSDTYIPEAIEFAENELENRGLSGEQLEALERQLKEEANIALEIEQKPLLFIWRISIFLCGLFFGIPLIIFIPLWLRFREEGSRRKNLELWLIGLAGLVVGLAVRFLGIPPWG